MVASHSLKLILCWEESHVKGLNASTGFTVDIWDEVGVQFWDQATEGDKRASGFLPVRQAILETLKAQEGIQERIISCCFQSLQTCVD